MWRRAESNTDTNIPPAETTGTTGQADHPMKGGDHQAAELRTRCINYCPGALSARMGRLALRGAREVAVLASNLRAEHIKIDGDIRLQRLGAWKQRQHYWLANKKGKLFNWMKDQGSKPTDPMVLQTLVPRKGHQPPG